MKVNAHRRPFSLATRLTFFISLATILAFAAFTGMMLHSVEKHFAEQDVNDLKQVNATLNAQLTAPDVSEAEKLANIQSALAGYRNIVVLLRSQNNPLLYRSPTGPVADLCLSPVFPGVEIPAYVPLGRQQYAADGRPRRQRHADGDLPGYRLHDPER